VVLLKALANKGLLAAVLAEPLGGYEQSLNTTQPFETFGTWAASCAVVSLRALQLLVNVRPELTNATNSRGMTPLHCAVAAKNVDKVRYLHGLQSQPRVDLKKKDDAGKTPRDAAVDTDSDAVIDVFSRAGSARSVTKDGLAVAATCGSADFRFLQADVNVVTNEGDSAFSEALILYGERQARLLFALLQHPAFDVNAHWKEKTGLTFVAHSRHIAHVLLCWLVEVAGADVDAADKAGSYALLRAVYAGNIDKVQYLLGLATRGWLDVNVSDAESKTAPMLLAQRLPQLAQQLGASSSSVAKLTDLGARFEALGSAPRVARSRAVEDLVDALRRGDMVAVRCWAGAGAKLTASERAQVLGAVFETLPALVPRPLYATFAIPDTTVQQLWHGMAPVLVVTALRLLRAHGVDLCAPWHVDGYTPLTFAAASPTVPVSALRWLLETARVPVAAPDSRQRTALHCAVESNQAEKLRLLLQTRDVSVAARDATNRTACELAASLGLTQFASWLRADEVRGGFGSVCISCSRARFYPRVRVRACVRALVWMQCLRQGKPMPFSVRTSSWHAVAVIVGWGFYFLVCVWHTQAPMFALILGTKRAHGSATRDVQAFEEYATRSGATALGFANVTAATLEAAVCLFAGFLKDVPADAPVAPLVFVHYSGAGVAASDGTALLELCPDASGRRAVYSLRRLVARLDVALRGRGTVIVSADLSNSASDTTMEDVSAADEPACPCSVDVCTVVAAPRVDDAQQAVLGPLTAIVLQTLSQCPRGVLLTPATFTADVVAAAEAAGVPTMASTYCSRGTTFAMATPRYACVYVCMCVYVYVFVSVGSFACACACVCVFGQ
jgi:ankyrin repeat protein